MLCVCVGVCARSHLSTVWARLFKPTVCTLSCGVQKYGLWRAGFLIWLAAVTPPIGPAGLHHWNEQPIRGTCDDLTLQITQVRVYFERLNENAHTGGRSICRGCFMFLASFGAHFITPSRFIPMLQPDADIYCIFSQMYKHSDKVTFHC